MDAFDTLPADSALNALDISDEDVNSVISDYSSLASGTLSNDEIGGMQAGAAEKSGSVKEWTDETVEYLKKLMKKLGMK